MKQERWPPRKDGGHRIFAIRPRRPQGQGRDDMAHHCRAVDLGMELVMASMAGAARERSRDVSPNPFDRVSPDHETGGAGTHKG
jgi:hypothetical protein